MDSDSSCSYCCSICYSNNYRRGHLSPRQYDDIDQHAMHIALIFHDLDKKSYKKSIKLYNELDSYAELVEKCKYNFYPNNTLLAFQNLYYIDYDEMKQDIKRLESRGKEEIKIIKNIIEKRNVSWYKCESTFEKERILSCLILHSSKNILTVINSLKKFKLPNIVLSLIFEYILNDSYNIKPYSLCYKCSDQGYEKHRTINYYNTIRCLEESKCYTFFGFDNQTCKLCYKAYNERMYQFKFYNKKKKKTKKKKKKTKNNNELKRKRKKSNRRLNKNECKTW